MKHRGLQHIGALALLIAASLCNFSARAQEEALWQGATLYRDEWGVPHVYAENYEALGFVFGYAQAEDHLSDMLMAYRVALGRAAEILGEEYAESDAFSIKMGHADLAAHAWESIDPLTGALCSGFARGVNLWIVEHPDRTPTWAEGVQPKDILALWHAYLMSMAPLDMPEVWRREAAAHTGNAWAVGPARSESGGAMLAVNAHQYHTGYFKWYEAHLVMPGYNMYGATLYGLPVLLQGHNGMLGWALTPNQADTADVYKEPIAEVANDPSTVNNPIAAIPQRAGVLLEYASRAKPYYVRTADRGLEERQVPQWITDRGPVMGAGSDYFDVWRIGGYRNFGGLAQVFWMGAAQSLTDFQNALFEQQLPCFHIVYADRAGNLFYLYNAVTGVRDAYSEISEALQDKVEPFNWKAPLPPYNDHIFWSRVFSPEELPYALNPKSGYLQACGNPPWGATDDSGIDAAAWPWWLSGDPDTYRAMRVRELLRGGVRNFQDMQNMLYDDALPAAKDMCGLLLAAADANAEFVKNAHPDLGPALETLRAWTQSAEIESPAMTFYHLWWSVLQAQNPLGATSNVPLYEACLQNTPESQRTLLNAAAEAMRLMRNQYDSAAIPWGDVHRLVRGNKEIPVAGSATGEPIFINSDYAYKDGRWQVTYGYGFAMAVEFGANPRAKSIVPFGASESPTSPHYADQLELFAKKQFKQTYFLMEDVARNAVFAYGKSVTLYPKGVDAALYAYSNKAVQAQVETLADAPVPLPEGAANFSLMVKPELTPRPEEMFFQYDVRISAALCAPENMGQLALYGYTEAQGWQLLEDQNQNAEMGVISGRVAYPVLLAVLGPKELMPDSFGGALAQNEGEVTPPDTATIDEGIEPKLPKINAPERYFSFYRPAAPQPDGLDAPPLATGDEEQRTFSFQRNDLPAGVKTEDTLDGKGGAATLVAPKGERQFKFERNDKPDAPKAPEEMPSETPEPATTNEDAESPEQLELLPAPEEMPVSASPSAQPEATAEPEAMPEPEATPAPEISPEPESEGPTGKRQFKFERKD